MFYVSVKQDQLDSLNSPSTVWKVNTNSEVLAKYCPTIFGDNGTDLMSSFVDDGNALEDFMAEDWSDCAEKTSPNSVIPNEKAKLKTSPGSVKRCLLDEFDDNPKKKMKNIDDNFENI